MDEHQNPTDTAGSTKRDSVVEHLVECTSQFEERFQIVEHIGTGGFARVFRAFDSVLNRHVAVKFPRLDRVTARSAVNQFLNEGRALAKVKHPAVVEVFDVGVAENDQPYVITRFIEGQTLSSLVGESDTNVFWLIDVFIQVAEALHEVHKYGIYHRDIKPGNILLSSDNSVSLVDFGLSLSDCQVSGNGKVELCGTPNYMAPEQVRGENHRIDGRTDIWGLGVTMYKILTGVFPFQEDDKVRLSDVICYAEPRPLRELNDQMPVELERICMKCLAKLRSERFQTAAELIEELSAIADGTTQGSATADVSGAKVPAKGKLVPKGLNSFTENDSEFFLELLPGPRDRFGYPESIRFWKTKIENSHGAEKFPVGVIYGPSGSGKSSFVHAGLIPTLDKSVNTFCIDCDLNGTAQALAKRISIANDFDPQGSLSDTIRELRVHSSPQRPTLIVLDQFERWLAGNDDLDNADLVDALRQCDGQLIQCMLVVRDDFWMGLDRLMKSLDIPISQRHNALGIQPFDKRHARKVLELFGRAFGSLPGEYKSLDRQQIRFLKESVNSLADEGRVTSIHLAIFAEMMKAEEWTPESLRRAGGWKGIGNRFVEQVFSGPQYQDMDEQDQYAIQDVLTIMLPSRTSQITGSIVSMQQLQQSLPNVSKKRLKRSLKFLEQYTGMISPVDKLRVGTDPEDALHESDVGFQLTHDFLIAPVRQWLNQKKADTWQGRASLRMDELEPWWANKREDRHLPSLADTVRISAGVPQHSMSETGREMLKAARGYYLIRGLAAMTVGILVLFAVFVSWQMFRLERAKSQLHQILSKPAFAVAHEIKSLQPYRSILQPVLDDYTNSTDVTERFRAAVAYAYLYPFDQNICSQLIDDMVQIDDSDYSRLEFRNVATALDRWSGEATPVIRQKFQAASDQDSSRIRLALTGLALDDASMAEQLVANRKDPTAATRMTHRLADWHWDLKRLARTAEQGTNDLLFAMMVAVGQIADRDLAEDDKGTWSDLITRNFETNPDGGIHSVCRWLAFRWNIELPKEPSLDSPPTDRDWWRCRFAAGQFLDFVRIKPGSFAKGSGIARQLGKKKAVVVEDVAITTELWIGTTELPSCFLRSWLASGDVDESTQKKLQTSPYHERSMIDQSLEPIMGISFNSGAKLVDWLNRSNCLPVAYKFSGENAVPLATDSRFSIITNDEWEYVCRAGSETAFFWGDFSQQNLIARYAVHQQFSVELPIMNVKPGGTRIPNRHGVFDLVGNVDEICLNNVDRETGAVTVVFRGGHCCFPQSFPSASGSDWEKPPDMNFTVLGLRLIYKR